MGNLFDGQWQDQDAIVQDGAFVRSSSAYGAELGNDVIAMMQSDPVSVLLIGSLSCPWSHRAMLVRSFKRLSRVPLHIAHGRRVEGYAMDGGRSWPVPGLGRGIVHLHELYTLGDPDYTGRSTVPVLWDIPGLRIVSNESAMIMRALDAIRPEPHDQDLPDFTLVPTESLAEIEALNAWIGADLSNAVYQAGFAEAQAPYDEAVGRVFATLDALESHLSNRRFMLGSILSETDLRLFPTLVRFDTVYNLLFRCSRRRLIDYPSLWAYARDVYALPGIAETVDFTEIRTASYENDRTTNPFGIVAVAPDIDWLAPHGRAALGPARVAGRAGGTIEITSPQFERKFGRPA